MNRVLDFVQDGAPPRPIAPAFDLTVQVGDGVRGLGRVINVLALLDITPTEFTAADSESGLQVRARITGDGAAARLGLARLRALPCVRGAWLAARKFEAAPYLASVC